MFLVSAVLNPDRCVPPSLVFMLFTKLSSVSEYPWLYCIATSICVLSLCPSMSIGSCIVVFPVFRNCVKELSPPSE